jgi:hypothetical protein
VPTPERLGPDVGENLQDCWQPAIQLDKEQAIMVRELDATMQPAPQIIQLISKHRILSFKPQLRLEWRGQNRQSETEHPNHSTSLGDSITSSTRIGFSVHKRSRMGIQSALEAQPSGNTTASRDEADLSTFSDHSLDNLSNRTASRRIGRLDPSDSSLVQPGLRRQQFRKLV